MKKILFILSISILTACSMKVDENIARQKAEAVLELLKNHRYEEMKEHYSASFNASESLEIRKEKFEQIESASGPIKSYEFVSSDKKVIDERDMLILKYKVICERLTLTHDFMIANEEGEHVILNHGITNQ